MDLNDAAQAGYDIDALIAAARSDDPITGKNWAKLAEEGLKFITELAKKLESAQDIQRALAYISAFMGDKSRRYAAGAALATRQADANAILTGMRGVPRDWRPAVRDLRTAIEDEARTVKRALEQREDDYRAKVIDAVLREVGAKGLKCPPGFEVDPDGVRDDDGVICAAPIAIIGQAVDFDDGAIWLELAWRRGNEWHRKLVDRGQVFESRSLAKLAHDGAPVGSHNAAALVKYFAAFEAQNINKMPCRMVSRHMGWHGDAFVVGDWSTPEGSIGVVEDQGFAAPFHTTGTWDGWCEVVDELLKDKPMVMLAIYAAVAAVMLHPLKASGFIVDWSGETSQGKTTALQAGSSVGGRPGSMANPDGCMRSWRSASGVGPMWLAWFYQSVPLILDDTRRASNPRVVEQALYDIPAGKDSIRGTADGNVRREKTWKTVLLTSGEAPITSFSKAGGAQARVLAVKGSPLGENLTDEQGRELALAIEARLHEHNGHLLRRVVSYLVANRERWPDMVEARKKLETEYAKRIQSKVGGRLAGYVATIACAAKLCHKLGVPGSPDAALDLLVKSAQDGAARGDMPREAMDALYTWAQMNEANFLGRFVDEHGGQLGQQPIGGWYGRWPAGQSWSEIGFQRTLVERKLTEWNYRSDDVLSAWHRRGWLETKDQGMEKRYGKGGSALLVIKRSALLPVS